MSYNLTSLGSVKRLSGIESGEINDAELLDYIYDISTDIYETFGRPIRKVTTTIESNGYRYNLDRSKKNIYSVDYVEIEGVELVEGVGSDFTVDLDEGRVILGSDVVDANTGKTLEVEFIPIVYSIFANLKTARKALAALYIFTGKEPVTAQSVYLDNEIDRVGSLIRPQRKGVIMSTAGINYDPRTGTPVTQNFNNEF